MNQATIKTLDQQRAKHAWELVESVASNPDTKGKKEFGTQAKKMPTRILAAGLGQALAFLAAKDYAPALRQALDSWMELRRPGGRGLALLARIHEGDADFLRFATAECLAYLQWVVRFADAKELTKEGD